MHRALKDPIRKASRKLPGRLTSFLRSSSFPLLLFGQQVASELHLDLKAVTTEPWRTQESQKIKNMLDSDITFLMFSFGTFKH